MTEEEQQKVREELDEWSELLSITTTPFFEKFIHRPEKTIFLSTGNQWGKNVNIMKQYILRWMGKHPIESKNLRPTTKIRTYRFCSETVPFDPTGEDSNTIYPVLKRLLPAKFILEDVNQRRNTMTIKDFQGGPNFYIEFSSYNQTIQKQAGKQRASIYLDENCSRAYMEEQKPRLLASDGDMIIGMTPALGQITWQFEDIYEKARIIIRTPRVVKRFKLRFNEVYPQEYITGNDSDICVMMAATDDNPAYDILVKDKNEKDLELIRSGRHHLYKTEAEFVPITKSEYIKQKLDIFDDETEDVRRYGIFRQVAGRIFKEFAPLHVIESSKYFPDGLPHDWLFGRGIDYHQKTPWHTTFIALSPDDEAFVWAESVLSPDSFVTAQIARDIAEKGRDYKFRYNKIDPLAEQTQVNTGLTTIDDLNRIFHELKDQGVGTGGWWSSWDSKSTRGREEVKRRLLNSKMAGTPFNNKGIGPTIWFMSSCRVTIDAIKNWRYEEWADRSKLEIKEAKETPMQKYSHICTAIECLFKEEGFKGKRPVEYKPRHTARQYGQRT